MGQKIIYFLLVIAMVGGLFFYSKGILLINVYVLIVATIFSMIFPKTFAMGVSKEDKRSSITKLVCMGFMTGLIFFAQYLQDPVMTGIYVGILISYIAKFLSKKIFKIFKKGR